MKLIFLLYLASLSIVWSSPFQPPLLLLRISHYLCKLVPSFGKSDYQLWVAWAGFQQQWISYGFLGLHVQRF